MWIHCANHWALCNKRLNIHYSLSVRSCVHISFKFGLALSRLDERHCKTLHLWLRRISRGLRHYQAVHPLPKALGVQDFTSDSCLSWWPNTGYVLGVPNPKHNPKHKPKACRKQKCDDAASQTDGEWLCQMFASDLTELMREWNCLF